jgi:hypothetical protein
MTFRCEASAVPETPGSSVRRSLHVRPKPPAARPGRDCVAQPFGRGVVGQTSDEAPERLQLRESVPARRTPFEMLIELGRLVKAQLVVDVRVQPPTDFATIHSFFIKLRSRCLYSRTPPATPHARSCLRL